MKKILVVDDEEKIRLIINNIFALQQSMIPRNLFKKDMNMQQTRNQMKILGMY